MRKIGIGIIGAGRMGDRHAEAYRRMSDQVNIIGFLDVVPKKAKDLAEKYGTNWFTSVEKLLSKPNLDAVSVCTPTVAHAAPCVKCVEAGKHVLVEKPLAYNLEDCDRMIRASDKAGVVFMVGQVNRFLPSQVEAKKVIERGDIGEAIMGIDFAMGPGGLPGKQGMPDWVKFKAKGGGNLMDLGVHSVDRLRWWFASDVESVYTVESRNYAKVGDADTHDMAVLRFRNGACAIVTIACPSPGVYENSTKIIGTKAVLYIQLGKIVKLGTRSWKNIPFPFSVSPNEMFPSYSHNIAGFEAELREFVSSLLEERKPLVTGYDGRAAVETVLAMYKSYEKHLPVQLPLKS